VERLETSLLLINLVFVSRRRCKWHQQTFAKFPHDTIAQSFAGFDHLRMGREGARAVCARRITPECLLGSSPHILHTPRRACVFMCVGEHILAQIASAQITIIANKARAINI